MNLDRFKVGKIVVALAIPSLLLASTPKIITYKSQKDFEKGQAKGVSISDIGEIRLAPSTQEVFAPEIPFIWLTEIDRQGNVFIAGGNTGEVHKVDKTNNSSVYFDSGDQQIYDLVVDQQDNLYVATSPEGKVYKVPAGGGVDKDSSVFFDPDEVYIWSMAIEQSGNLFVAHNPTPQEVPKGT